MESQKVHIRIWEFKQGNNAKETAYKNAMYMEKSQ